MSDTPKRMNLSDLVHDSDSLSSNKAQQGGPGSAQNDGEEVRREPRKIISGQDEGTTKNRTQVYQFGKLRSSQG